MINANWLFLIIPGCSFLALFFLIILTSGKRIDERIQEEVDKEEKLEIIEEVFNEHGDCEHDVVEPTSDVPGEHFVSYCISKKGKEKILEAL